MYFELFSESELAQLHEASLEILANTGLAVKSARFRKLLLDNGCKEQGERVVLPPEVVERSLRTVPSRFTLYGRSEGYALEMGAHKAYAQTCVGTPSIIDLNNGEKRDVCLQDLADYCRLADALEYIDIISPIFPRDVPQEMIVTVETATMLRNSSKPLRITAESAHELPYVIDVLKAAAGGQDALRQRPIAYLEVSPMSPLDYGNDPAEALWTIVEAGLPLGIIPCPMMGSTGPMTMAGTVAQHNAEILAGVAASQMLRPGCPVIMSPRATFMDMRSGLGLWAMPEMGLAAAASVQLAKHYGIPSTATGYSGAAKTADAQSGYEHLYNALLPALIGTDVLAAAGSLDNVLTSCFAMLVIDNELSSVIRRTLSGMEVTEDKLAVDVIAEVVGSHGNFLAHKHTRKYLRAGELWTPLVSDRQTYERWAAGKETVTERAARWAAELLRTHQVIPLDSKTDQEIETILRQAALQTD